MRIDVWLKLVPCTDTFFQTRRKGPFFRTSVALRIFRRLTRSGCHHLCLYSNKSRLMRKKAGEAAGSAEEVENSSATVGAEEASSSRSRQSWAMLIKRVYESDPMSCPECGGQMEVVAFIEPPQAEVIEKILRHCGLWRSSAARAPPANAGRDGMEGASPSDREPNELTYVDMDTFLANF